MDQSLVASRVSDSDPRFLAEADRGTGYPVLRRRRASASALDDFSYRDPNGYVRQESRPRWFGDVPACVLVSKAFHPPVPALHDWLTPDAGPPQSKARNAKADTLREVRRSGTHWISCLPVTIQKSFLSSRGTRVRSANNYCGGAKSWATVCFPHSPPQKSPNAGTAFCGSRRRRVAPARRRPSCAISPFCHTPSRLQ